MARLNRPFLVLGLSAALMIGALGVVSVLGLRDDGPVRDASDQAEAVRLARDVDLPALGKADRVVIEQFGSAGVERAVHCGPEVVAELRRVLRADTIPPSGGIATYRLLFYQGDRLIRGLWLFPYGEWGFEREGISWTIGSDPAVVLVVEKWVRSGNRPVGRKP